MTSFASHSSTPTILQLLEISKQDQADSGIVHAHIKSMLAAQDVERLREQTAYSSLLSTLLTHKKPQIQTNSPLHQHLEILKLRLNARPGVAELDEIQNFITDIVSNLPDDEPETKSNNFSADRTPADTADDSVPAQPAQYFDPVPAASLPIFGPPLPKNELLILDEKRKRMEEIQAALSLHLAEVTDQNRALGKALKDESQSISNSTDVADLQALKSELSGEISKLLQGHQALTEKLDSANKFMQIIENEGQHLNEELKKAHTLSMTDELTQLPNRRAFFKRIEDEVSRVQRYEYPLCLAVIDLDAFKAVNDRYGHTAGDEVLRSFAERALSGFRHHDLASRYGGEEFAVILPNTDIAGAQRALEKVRGRTSQCTFQANGNTLPIPTFSAGISLYVAGDTPASLIERADQALYRAKRLGRNRIEIAEPAENNGAMAPPSHRSS